MTSPDTPDTGAGTPTNLVSPLHPHEPQTPPVIDDEGRCLVCVVEVRLQDIGRVVADLARRSRPATDPAGLDALTEALTAWLDSHGEADIEERLADAAKDWLDARLSVADGPGPEERPEVEPVRIVRQGDGSTIEIRHFPADR